MATYTLGSWSASRDRATERSIADALPRRRGFGPRRPLVALAVIALTAAGFVLFPADAAGEEVAPGQFVLTASNGNCVDSSSSDSCDSGTPAGSNGKGCENGNGLKDKQEKGQSDKSQGADCAGSNDTTPPPAGDDDDDDDVPAGDDDDDDVPAGDDDDDDVPAGDDDDDDSSGSTPGGTDILGVVEENDESGDPDDGDGSTPPAQVLGKTEEARVVPEALAFTGPGAVAHLALGGSSLIAAGAAMILGGRRRRSGVEE